MPAPVSMCLIARDEPLLGEAIASVRSHVEEVIVVVTCGGDTISIDAARQAGADRVEVFEGCNDVPGKEGLIADFSVARNYSFSLATKPWVMWMDADDIVLGLERLPEVLAVLQLAKAAGNEVGAQFAYEYNHNDQGVCDCLQYRERIFSSTAAFKWMDACHEVCVNVVDRAMVLPPETFQQIVWKHRRNKSPRPAPWAASTDYPEGIFVHHQGNRYRCLKGGRSSLEGPWGPGVCDEGECRWEFWRKEDPNRNLRIMRAEYQKKPEAGRTLYYYGQALADAGEFDEAVSIYTKYVDLSAWDDEKALACFRVSAIFTAKLKWKEAIAWAMRGIATRENWSEGYLYLCRIYYFMARSEPADPFRNWQRCVHFGKLGLSLPPTSTVLFINPVERDFEVHMYMHFAKSYVGDIRGALESAEIALKAKPENTDFLVNKLLFGERIAKEEARASLGKLKAASLEIVRKFNHRRARAETFDMLDKALGDELPLVPLEDRLDATLPPKQETNGISHQATAGGGLDIVIACGDCWEQWNPKTAAEAGIGGSETAVIEVAKRLRAKGHRVRVFTSCGEPATYDGVEYRQTTEFFSIGSCQVLICWRHASLVDNCQALIKLLWVHDVYAMGVSRDNLAKFDRIFALSEWHKQYLVDYHTRQGHGIDQSRVFVTRNGVDLARFDQQVERDPHRAVYSSSADRGLEQLLSMWPAIRGAVPDAKLDIFYGVYNWEKMAIANKDTEGLLRIERLKGAIQILKGSGVSYFGRVNQLDLAKAYLSAGVWTFPTWFTETNCISAQEAHAAGLAMVTSPLAALNETVNGRGVLVPGDWLSEDYKRRFIEATVEAMRSTPEDKRRELQAYARNNFSWDGVVLQWEALFVELLSQPQAPAASVEQKPKYQPVGAPAYEGAL